MDELSNKRVCVVVLGDIGHSPRMQYHVRSLLQHGCDVDLIGYVETKPHLSLLQYEKLRIHQLTPVPELGLPNFVRLVTKTIWQFLTLLVALISIRTPEFLLCQNPPAIPTLVCCYYVCCLRKTKLIIDWHNYTHTILALAAGPEGRPSSKGTIYLVQVAKWVEGYYGKRAFGNLCVTKAMRDDLHQNWGVKATVLYDRPPEHFRSISMQEKHNLFMKLSKMYPAFLPRNSDDFKASGVQESTCFTQKLHSGSIVAKPNRPGLVISSTSWTPDEDFEILLTAMDRFEARVSQSGSQLPDLFCVITGKGPLKKDYEKRIVERNWKHIQVVMPWLEAEDYPRILAASDLGVCLHYSSSGLDLPMKVVDMFGCGLPVCAINFKSIGELVVHKQNGFVFDTKDELFDYLCYWFVRFPSNETLDNIKSEFADNLRSFQNLRWTENWNSTAMPLFI